MTAKRFKFICDDEKCFFKDGNKALYCYEVVDLLNSLSDENEQLKAQLSYKSISVCIICKHHYLVKTDKEYYISKCKKEYEKCSKGDVKYCEDFELVRDDIE